MNGWMEKLKGITLKLDNGLIKEVQARKKKSVKFSSKLVLYSQRVSPVGHPTKLNNGHYFAVRIVLVRNFQKIMKVKL